MVRCSPWLLGVVCIVLSSTLWGVKSWVDDRAALETAYLITRLPVEEDRSWNARVTSWYDHWRGVRFFRRMARAATAGAQTDRERLDQLVEWTYLHVRPSAWAAPARLHFDDPYRTVKRGFGMCDQSAHVFVELARAVDFKARLFFLEDDQGTSPHTVAQVLLDGEWILVDSLAGRLLEAGGTPLTIEALHQHPELLETAYEGIRPYLLLTAADFVRGRVPYGDTEPWRRVPQEPLDVPEFPVEESESVLAYDKFRQAMLDGEWARSEALYEELSQMPLQKTLAQAAAYHLVLVAFEAGHWELVVERARETLSSDPQTPWRKSVFELAGTANERLGNVGAAIAQYAKADLPSTRLRAQSLMRN